MTAEIYPEAKPGRDADLRHVLLAVTRVCNLSCTYCSQNHRKDARMTAETARRCLDRELALAAEGKAPGLPIVVEFYGGEPLLNEEVIRETVEWAVSRHGEGAFLFRFMTNGTAGTPRMRRWLERNRERVSVGLSLDGLGEMNLRNRGSRAVDAGWFRRNWPDRPVSMLVHPATVGLLLPAIRELRAGRIPFEVAAADGAVWSAGDADALFAGLVAGAELLGDYGETVASGLAPFDPVRFFSGEKGKPHHFCGDKPSMAFCDTDGERYFCQMFSPSALGDDAARKWRGELAAAEWIAPAPECAECPAGSFCRPCFGWRCKLGSGPEDPVEKRTSCLATMAFAKASAVCFLRELARKSPDPGELSGGDLRRARNSVRFLQGCGEGN